MELLYKNETYKIRGVLFGVYNELGPGFLEKIYKRAVAEELEKQHIPYVAEKKFTIRYNNKIIGYNLIDLIVFHKIILELKAVNNLERFHTSQVLAYLKATGLNLGLLVNFGADKLGIKRIIFTDHADK
ncbi:MAG: GxxExxY protein [Patescibacteria group bacterium]